MTWEFRFQILGAFSEAGCDLKIGFKGNSSVCDSASWPDFLLTLLDVSQQTLGCEVTVNQLYKLFCRIWNMNLRNNISLWK